MASIRARSNGGNLFFDFQYQGFRCREQTLLKDTATNRKKLERVLAKIEKSILNGTFEYREYFPNSNMIKKLEAVQPEAEPEPDTPLFKDFAKEWLQENEVRWKDSYRKIIEGTLEKYLIPEFGKKEVSNITKSQVLKFRASLAKVKRGTQRALSNDRINHIMTPLRMILEDAADRYEFSMPLNGVKALKVDKTDVEPFSLEEVQKFLAKVRSDFRDYYIVRFFSGLRTAEVDGLQWKYVDFTNRRILVRETIVQGQMTTTKTPESRREVEMSTPVFEALKRQQKASKTSRTFVFTNARGKPLEHRNVTQRVWYPTLEKALLKRRRPYQTRHTAATLWMASGENPEWIARQMGHTTTRMLFTIYSSYVPNITRQDGSAMDRLLTSEGFDHA
ncbi:MAG: integrase [Oceanospirillaceae bacterium]|jgi:integrase|nr:integrase [Oceanospirillaceae bacterium]